MGTQGLDGLGDVTRLLWAKSDRGQTDARIGPCWLPLYVHMADSFHVCERLWDEWAPQGTKSVIVDDCGGDSRLARTLVTFLAGVHDLGKASAEFQSQTWGVGEDSNLLWKLKGSGLPFLGDPDVCSKGDQWLGHPLIGDVALIEYLEKHGWTGRDGRRKARFLGGILAAHHGKIPVPETPMSGTTNDIRRINNWDIRSGYFNEKPKKAGKYNRLNAENKAWQSVQFELVDYVRALAGLSDDDLNRVKTLHIHDEPPAILGAETQSLIIGIVIMSDWIASNTSLFPLVPARPYDCDGETEQGAALLYECALINTDEGLRRRAERAWKKLALPPSWREDRIPDSDEMMFAERFRFPNHAKPRPVQSTAVDIARDVKKPGIMVIEAPMGEGKTEAALAVAEIYTHNAGRGGVCMALPTMATTDAMFERIHAWVERLGQDSSSSLNQHTMFLAHGKAGLNKEYAQMVRSSHFQDINMDGANEGHTPQREVKATQQAIVNDWFYGRKRGVLANFLVCTVDQVLMAALRMKHVMLRQLGLVNKVVIIDECHAYDAYMQQYLERSLEWLGGCRAPVVLLSATLPNTLRNRLIAAYQRGALKQADDQSLELPVLEKCAYPVITYTDGSSVQSRTVQSSGRRTSVECYAIDDDVSTAAGVLRECLADGGCAGVICDTVARAQHMYGVLKNEFGQSHVILLHSRFIDCDRFDKEGLLREKLGPKATRSNGKRPQKCIVVGTQVLEQSLDIDFDVLVTDIAPIDLLLQRLGRVHRHTRGVEEIDRPERVRSACCYVRGINRWVDSGPVFPKALVSVYQSASLKEALASLGFINAAGRVTVRLPDDIAPMVRTAYEDDDQSRIEGLSIPEAWRVAYLEDCAERKAYVAEEESKALGYRLHDPVIQDFNNVPWEDGDVVLRGDDVNTEEEKGQMAVRDTQDTVEVLLVRRCGDHIALLPWVMGGEELPLGEIPSNDVSVQLVQCAIRLPLGVCRDVDALIRELEDGCQQFVRNWQDSPWLAGRLLLVLDEEEDGSFGTNLAGRHVCYSREMGLHTCPIN